MSIQRSIVQRLLESRGLTEAEFTSGGSTYKCVFGKYYKDGEPIDRDEYFRAKGDTDSHNSETPSTDSAEPQDIDSELDYLEDEIEEITKELKQTDYDDRSSLEDRLTSIRRRISAMEDDMSDEQYERSQSIYDSIPDPDDINYEEPEPDWDMMPGGHDDY